MEVELKTNPLSDFIYFTIEKCNPLSFPMGRLVEFNCSRELKGSTFAEIVAEKGIIDPSEKNQRPGIEYKLLEADKYPISHSSKIIPSWVIKDLEDYITSNWDEYKKIYDHYIYKLEEDTIRFLLENAYVYQIPNLIDEYTEGKLKEDKLKIFLSPFHPGASALFNSWSIFGPINRKVEEISKYYLSRLIGHEFTHLIIRNEIQGYNIQKEIIEPYLKKVENAEYKANWIEEIICISMQHRMTVDCKLVPDEEEKILAIDTTLQQNIQIVEKKDESFAIRLKELYILIQNRFRIGDTKNLKKILEECIEQWNINY